MNMNILVSMGVRYMVAAAAVSAVCYSFGQGFQDPGMNMAFNVFSEIKQQVRELDAVIAENERTAAGIENRAGRGFLFREQISGLDIGEFDEFGARNELSQYVMEGDWRKSVFVCELILIKTNGPTKPGLGANLNLPIIRLSDYVMLALLDLNLGQSDKAIANLETAIEMMKFRFGEGTERAASAFLNLVRQGKVNVAFSCNQIYGLSKVIMADATTVDNIRQNRLNAYLDAELAKGANKLQAVRNEHRRITQQERTRAKDEFRRNTGLEFDRTYRPDSGGTLQREWDRCDEILGIFKEIDK